MIPPKATLVRPATLLTPSGMFQASGERSPAPGGAADRLESKGRPKRILVIEDDEPIRAALAMLLDEEGYQVSTADDGEDAFDRLEANTDALPDLILLDLRMPVMDGWEFRAAQRRNSRLATIPVVVVSADGSAHAAAISAEAFLRKPLDTGTLLATIARVLSEDRQRRSSTQWQRVERLASLGRVAAGIGHEIDNPANTNALVRITETIRGDLREIQETLTDSLVGLERIRAVVHNLQILSRKLDGNWKAVQIETVLDASIAIALNHIQHRAVITKRYGTVPQIRGSAGALGQVFLNLLMNAAQAIPEGGVARNEISIVTSFDGLNVLVEIGDTGQGIAADVLPHIFDPFFTTKSANAGTGLGLAISHQIIEEHGGRLAIESEPGFGTICSVYLAAAGVSEEAPILPNTPPGFTASRAERRGRVLVIDDEPMIGWLVARVLAGRHDVVAAQSAEEAFDRLAAGERFDLVLCDLLMPNISGPQVHDTFVSRWPSLLPRLVFTSGGAFGSESVAFLKRTLCPVLYKPFGPKDLEDLVNAHLCHPEYGG